MRLLLLTETGVMGTRFFFLPLETTKFWKIYVNFKTNKGHAYQDNGNFAVAWS